MPYVRTRGRQLALVHGSRRKEDSAVEQQVLFTIHSKAEAREAIGEGSPAGPGFFEHLVEGLHPTLRFDWKRIREQISAQLDVLPETYDYADARLRRGFREALVAFTRQVLLADPQNLHVASQLLAEQHQELSYLRELIDGRLRHTREQANEWNQDNPFLWRYQVLQGDIGADADEMVIDLYERGEFDQLEPRCRLLVECFPNFADGHNTLGLIALRRDDLDGAEAHFRKTLEVGRTLFPKRIAKSSWWSDIATRPYLRGLANLALSLNRVGRYDEALEICQQLDACARGDIAAAYRGSIYLNQGRYSEAAASVHPLVEVDPTQGFVLAFARGALGRADEAVPALLHAALNHPRTARRLLGGRLGKPRIRQEWEDDERAGSLRRNLHAWFASGDRSGLRVLGELMRTDPLRSLADEVQELRLKDHTLRPADRSAFDRLREITSMDYARRLAQAITPPPGGREPRSGAPMLHLVH